MGRGILLTGLFALGVGIISCAGGGGLSDLSGLSKEQVYRAAEAVMGSKWNTTGMGMGISGYVGGSSGSLSTLAFKVHDQLQKKLKEGVTGFSDINRTCPEGGRVTGHVDQNNGSGSFNITFDNCSYDSGTTITCTVEGSFSVDQSTQQVNYSFTMKQGCQMASQEESMEVSGDLTMNMSLRVCGQTVDKYKGSFTVKGGPVTYTSGSNSATVSFDNFKVAEDAGCTNPGVLQTTIEGGISYSDNFCVNGEVNLQVSTPEPLTMDSNNYQLSCSGKVSINDGTVEIVYNSDCTYSVYRDGQPIAENVGSDYFGETVDQCQVPS